MITIGREWGSQLEKRVKTNVIRLQLGNGLMDELAINTNSKSATKERIVEAALGIFSSGDFHDATLRKIAKQSFNIPHKKKDNCQTRLKKN